MTRKQIQLGVLFLAVFIDMLGLGIVMPILPRYVEVLGASSWQIGLLVGIFSLAQLIMLPFWGHLSDRIGRRPVLIISMLGTAVGYLIMGWARSIPIMMVARAIDGAAGGNISTIQASISDITTPQERSRMMGALGASYGLGFILGPALGGWVSHYYGFAMPMFMTAGLAAVNLLLIAMVLPETRVRKEQQHPSLFFLLGHVEKKIYFPTLCTFFFFVLGFSMIMTLLALFFYHRYAVNELKVGYIYAMLGAVAIIIEGCFFGWLSKMIGDRNLANRGALLLAAASFLIPWTRSVEMAAGVCLLIALGDSLLSPSLPAIISRSAKEEWQGAAFGCYQSAGCLARCFGPLLAGVLLKVHFSQATTAHYGQVAFWTASGLLFIAFLCSLSIPKKNNSLLN